MGRVIVPCSVGWEIGDPLEQQGQTESQAIIMVVETFVQVEAVYGTASCWVEVCLRICP